MAQKQYYDEDGNLTTKQGAEEKKFLAATHFRVCVVLGGGNKNTAEFRTYWQALAVAVSINLIEPRAMIYAVTALGSDVCITRDMYQHYLDIYNNAAGTNYKYPPLQELERKLNPKTRG